MVSCPLISSPGSPSPSSPTPGSPAAPPRSTAPTSSAPPPPSTSRRLVGIIQNVVFALLCGFLKMSSFLQGRPDDRPRGHRATIVATLEFHTRGKQMIHIMD
jgi:hypothetical protein